MLLSCTPSFAVQPQPSPAIPQFYFPQPDALAQQTQQQVSAFLSAHMTGVTLDQLKVLLKQVSDEMSQF